MLRCGALSPKSRLPKSPKSPTGLGFALPIDQALNGEQLVNGFRTIPEIPSISVDDTNVAAFSMPQEVLDFVPDESAVVTHFKNGQRERKLYCNTELIQEEQQQLQLLRQEAQSQNLAFMPSVASSALRYVTRAKGVAKSAIKEMLGTQQWRQSYFQSGPITDASVAEDMKLGMVYYGGRDAGLRPSLVIRVERIPDSFKRDNGPARLVKLLVFCLEYMLHYLIYPGKIETSTIVLDLRGVSTTQIPVTPLREVVKVLSAHYIYRVHKFYLCNVPTMLRRMSGVGTRLLTERQLQKLCFVNDAAEILADFALHQLEEDLGGGRPSVTEFFPFPLQAGPFEAGSTVGDNRNAIPNAHLAFTAAGMRGRAWNPGLSREDNVAVEYTELAEDIFKRCGVSVPSSCPRKNVTASGSSPLPKKGKSDDGAIDIEEEQVAVVTGMPPWAVAMQQALMQHTTHEITGLRHEVDETKEDAVDNTSDESTCVNEPSDVPSSACDSRLADKQCHDRPTPGSKLAEKAFAEVSEQARLESAKSAPVWQARLEPVVDDAGVMPKSIFSCMPQCVTSCK